MRFESRILSVELVEANLHVAERASVFVGEAEAAVSGRFVVFVFFMLVLAKTYLEAQGEFHLVARFAQALYRGRHFGRTFDRFVDGRAELLHYLFRFVVNLQDPPRRSSADPCSFD